MCGVMYEAISFRLDWGWRQRGPAGVIGDQRVQTNWTLSIYSTVEDNEKLIFCIVSPCRRLFLTRGLDGASRAKLCRKPRYNP